MSSTREEQDLEANYFAMCLLIPEQMVRDEVDKVKGGLDLANPKKTKELAKKFQVSEMMMGVRLGQIYGKLLLALFSIALLSGCVGVVRELKKPPFPYSVTHHSRIVGIEASVPNQAGDSVFKLRLGFFSDTFSLIPCATNALSIPTISDTFKLGQNGIDTTITEDIQTGWSGQAPTPRFNRLFSPKDEKKKD